MELATAWLKMMFSRLPFARRLIFAFVLMTILVSGIFSFGIYQTVLFVEEHLISKELDEELSFILEEDIRNGLTPRLHPRTRFFASNAPEHPLPEHFDKLPTGFTEIVEEREALYVFLRESNGVRYALVQEQNDFEAREQTLFSITTTGFFLSTVGAWILGIFMAKRIMKPISMLASQVRTVDPAKNPHRMAVNYPDDEIGNLAHAFDSTFTLLHQALEREKLFTSDVSHELRTPLMIIASSCELLQESATDPEQHALLQSIERSTTDMRELVQTFLLLARNKNLSPAREEYATLDQIIKAQAVYWGERIQEKGIEFVQAYETSDSAVYNKPLLSAVLSNLLRNALYYTDSGTIRVTQFSGGVRVEDSGKGIPEAVQEQIFEPFVRGTTTGGDGLGLGLSLVKRICNHQSWKIHLSSPATGGTCFTLFLKHETT